MMEMEDSPYFREIVPFQGTYYSILGGGGVFNMCTCICRKSQPWIQHPKIMMCQTVVTVKRDSEIWNIVKAFSGFSWSGSLMTRGCAWSNFDFCFVCCVEKNWSIISEEKCSGILQWERCRTPRMPVAKTPGIAHLPFEVGCDPGHDHFRIKSVSSYFRAQDIGLTVVVIVGEARVRHKVWWSLLRSIEYDLVKTLKLGNIFFTPPISGIITLPTLGGIKPVQIYGDVWGISLTVRVPCLDWKMVSYDTTHLRVTNHWRPWRIIPVSKWLITMVSKSPIPGVVPFTNGRTSWLINGGY